MGKPQVRSQHELRRHCPVGHSERYDGFWFVVRYDDIHRIEQDPETFAVSPGMLLPPMGHVRPGIPIDIDPPMHTKYRRVMLPAFTPQRMNEMEPMVRRLARELLDEIGDAAEVDASKRFAVPMPMRVFCELAGLPIEDSERLEDWIDRIFYVRTHDYADTERAAAECCAYLARHFEAPIGCTCRKQHGTRVIMPVIGSVDFVVTLFHGESFHIYCLQDFHTKSPRLLCHTLREFLSTDALREAREIIQPNRNPGLSAKARALDQKRIRTFACSVDGSSQTRGSATDDDQVVVCLFGFSCESQFLRQFSICRFDEK